MGYWNDCIISNEGDLITLSHVESIREGHEEPIDQVAGVLKGDSVLLIRTSGGYQYTVSMLDTQTRMSPKFDGCDLMDMARSIVKRWQFIHSVKGTP